ncbi:MAG: precorrin-4 C(11)-methyltransferase [Prevotellaceae bacterium]|nr:precorrin-4 C(11)-methyltransferase [Prevotellaceae bacterium]
MRKAIVTISEESRPLAETIQRELGGDILRHNQVAEQWNNYEGFVFISALGICVRTIAPLLADKHRDPAVVCLDTTARHSIAVASGHVGGANCLAADVARTTGAEPIITTRSDNEGLWQLDTLAKRFGWTLEREDINNEIALFVNRRPTALLLEVRDRGTDWLEQNLPSHVTVFYKAEEIKKEDFDLIITVSHKPSACLWRNQQCAANTPHRGAGGHLHYIPRCLNIGIGLAHDADMDCIDEMRNCLLENGISPKAIKSFATIDLKKDEKVVKELQRRGYTFHFFTADELKDVEVPNPSPTVEKYVGTPSVCEAAALFNPPPGGRGTLLLPKQRGSQWTLAVAMDRSFIRCGHVEIVGAGPGDPELVSVRGKRLLQQADLILYAGSLVPRELTHYAKAGAVVRSSASMALEEQCSLMKEFTDRGKLVVRLHTGDPCIFGAIQEQMNFFEANGISYHITPGISSFLAAAAELRSQFTIPERCQTIILTRGEGRTPMPEREKLHLLARSRSTMCIFLSATLVDDVQAQLLQEYPAETPVAVCHHLTWRDQKIWRGQLSELANLVKENNLTLTTMIVVGEAVGNLTPHSSLPTPHSKLYDRSFTHLYRKGEE